MNSMLVRGRRIAVLIALLSVLVMSFAASASAQDIAVTKFTSSTVVAAGSNVTYEVTVSNSTGSTGPTTLTDTVPANMTFVSAGPAPAGWECTLPAAGSSGGTITCTHAADLPDDSSDVFTFVFQVVPGTANGTVITNTASISNEADNISTNDSSSIMVTVGEPPPPPLPPLAAKDVLISEFRLSGPGGSEDDFIELYCNRSADCDISGAFLRAYDPVNEGNFAMEFPADTVIPARQFLLVADRRGYTLDGYGFPDIDVALSQPPPADPPFPPFYFHDNEGLQLVTAGDPVILDSVGFTGGGNDFLYVEGTGLQRATARPADQYSYVRKRTMATNGLPQDTDNNADDFVLVSVTGNTHEGISAPPVLGAPGPKGLNSPLTYSNSQVTGALVDPDLSQHADPNRVRVGSGDSGTISFRRSFTNNTTDTFFYLSFRVIEITTTNSPTTLEDQAELRLVSSGTTFAEVPSRGPVTILGTVLEYDDCECPEPKQPNGGGLNSTVFTDNEEFLLGPGETIDVQFLLNVIKSGAYKFYIYVEAGSARAFPQQQTLSSGGSRLRFKPTTTPGKFVSVQRLPIVSAVKNPHHTPVIRQMTSPSRSSGPVRNGATPLSISNSTPRVIFINRGIAEGEKKPRRKKRIRRKSSAALKKKAEEKFAAEKLQN